MKIIKIFLLPILILIGSFLLLKKYDVFPKEYFLKKIPPAFVIKQMSEEDKIFLSEVKNQWKMLIEPQLCIEGATLYFLDYEGSIKNVIDLLTKNGIWKESEEMMSVCNYILSRAYPDSNDNIIYYNVEKRIFYIIMKSEKSIIYYYENNGNCYSTIYVAP